MTIINKKHVYSLVVKNGTKRKVCTTIKKRSVYGPVVNQNLSIRGSNLR